MTNLLVERVDRVLFVTLNRPTKLILTGEIIDAPKRCGSAW